MTAPACIHGCDGTLVETPTGLLPCPRHNLTAYEQWEKDTARRNQATATARRARPTPHPAQTPQIAAHRANARAALTRTNNQEISEP